MKKMLIPAEADERLASHAISCKTVQVELLKARNKVLAENIYSQRAYPPYHRIAMDGFAVWLNDDQAIPESFSYQGITFAGDPQQKLEDPSKALEVHTGGVLPMGANSIIPIENIDKDSLSKGIVRILDRKKVSKGQNIHSKGADYPENSIVLHDKQRIAATEMAILASEGKTKLLVYAEPRIAVLSTGSELVDIHEQPSEYQIRTSNLWFLKAAIEELGLEHSASFCKDDPALLKKQLQAALEQADIVLLTGGVSAGKADFIPALLQEIGVEQVFHKIAQKPGKPLWFGRKGEKAVFGLPGNPVSVFVCWCRYVRPYLLKAKALPVEPLLVKSDAALTNPSETLHFLQPGVYQSKQANSLFTPLRFNGSGDFVSMTKANGCIELPAFYRGEEHLFYPS